MPQQQADGAAVETSKQSAIFQSVFISECSTVVQVNDCANTYSDCYSYRFANSSCHASPFCATNNSAYTKTC